MSSPYCCNQRIFLLLIMICLLSIPSHGSSTAPLSPIRHLEASLAASSGQGTIAAVRSSLPNGKDFVVVVGRSPKRSGILFQNKEDEDSSAADGHCRDLFGLKLSVTPTDTNTRWTQLGSTALCSMTGFAADVQHLSRVTLRQVESHHMLYSQPMPINRIVRSMASTLQRVAQSQGGRPFGTQVCLVGVDKDSLQLYTLDPAGAWRHYGGGATAIGRFAPDVRKELWDHREKREEGHPKTTLKYAIDSLIGAATKNGFKADEDQLDGLVMWINEDGICQILAIHSDDMEECYIDCLKAI